MHENLPPPNALLIRPGILPGRTWGACSVMSPSLRGESRNALNAVQMNCWVRTMRCGNTRPYAGPQAGNRGAAQKNPYEESRDIRLRSCPRPPLRAPSSGREKTERQCVLAPGNYEYRDHRRSSVSHDEALARRYRGSRRFHSPPCVLLLGPQSGRERRFRLRQGSPGKSEELLRPAGGPSQCNGKHEGGVCFPWVYLCANKDKVTRQGRKLLALLPRDDQPFGG